MLEEHDDDLMGDCNDEGDESFQRQVFFVPSIEKDEDLSGPPMDGIEFIKRVVQERKKIDDLVVKQVPKKIQKSLRDQVLHFSDHTSDPEFCMDKETQLRIVSEFSKLRMRYEARCQEIPKANLKNLIQTLPKEDNEVDWSKILSNKPPSLAEALDSPNTSVELCLAISQMKICDVMEYMRDAISDKELSIPLACQWTYTLLACVNVPLHPDLFGTLREITRTLISHRAQLESIASEELPHINVVICIVGRYFNQLDLADPLD